MNYSTNFCNENLDTSLFSFLFRRGSVVAVMVVSLDSQFSGPAAVLVEKINLAESLGDLTFDNLFTNVKGISPFYFVPVRFSFVNMFLTLG